MPVGKDREPSPVLVNADTSEKCLDVSQTNYTFIPDETGKKIIDNAVERDSGRLDCENSSLSFLILDSFYAIIIQKKRIN